MKKILNDTLIAIMCAWSKAASEHEDTQDNTSLKVSYFWLGFI